MPAFKDLTGQRFGKLVVEYRLSEKKNNKYVWHCKCDCGNEKDIIGTQLTKANNPTQSCGCLQKERTRLANQSEDLSGKIYGRLTVVKRIPNSSKWECKCECGNTIITNTNHLNTGHTQSCGCLQKDRTIETSSFNLTGKTFGLLEVIGLNVEKSKPKARIYKCRCQCGNECDVRSNNLLSGDTQSCGCSRLSHGEIKISKLLQEYNISFEMEKSFDTCINPKTGKKLRFDFFVNNQYLIEYNGIQHYIDTGLTRETLEELQYRDSIKIQWAKENNIPLIIIPYTKYELITIDDLIP